MYLLGFDIGGTKCAALTAEWKGERLTKLARRELATDHGISGEEMLDRLFSAAEEILTARPDAVGISCGGPLDAERGVVISPPNLPRFRDLPVVSLATARFGVPAHLENDANASALAEWRFGAGRGCRNMVFLTFGTGLGAGLILDGRLYRGANGNAGEVGHIRLREDGPLGFGKHGSFEGFCSGGGIARMAETVAAEYTDAPAYLTVGEPITARGVAEAARRGDPAACRVFATVGERLGEGLSLLIDILNPDAIVIGSIYARCGDLLAEAAAEVIRREALDASASVCRILPAALGDEIGDFAACAAALL